MPVFHYKAYNSKGRQISGELEASSLKDAALSLKKDGIFPRELSPARKHKRASFSFARKVSLIDLATATRQIATLLQAGAALYDALNFLISEEENKILKAKFIDIKEKVAEGVSFAKALDAHSDVFPEVYKRMVEAGEASGTLESVLAGLADYLEDKADVNSKVSTALLYPALMSVVAVGVLSFLLIFVMPKITGIFEDTEQALPLATVILLGITDILKSFWYLIILVLAGGFWGLRRYIRTERGKEVKDELLLKTPFFGSLLRVFYSANLARTLGSLLHSGVPLIKALEMTTKVLDQAVFARVLDKSIKEVTEGGSLSKSFSGSVVPGLLVHMTAIGEQSGNLDELLLKAADTYARRFDTSITRALSLVEPVLILVMGFLVGFIVLAILLPIFQLNQLVG